jgi:hypothetical protein
MGLILGLAAGLALAPMGAPAPGVVVQDLQPWVLPWDDSAPGPTDAGAFLGIPSGPIVPIHVGADGHLYAAGQRARLLGVNLTFGAAFPDHGTAGALAGRLAKFGFNAVRLHHMDWQTFPNGIQKRRGAGDGSAPTSRQLDPEALDRLDYLIDQLGRHGIYADVNLLVSRQFVAGDGLPAPIEQLSWKDRHVVAMFDRRMIGLQKEYAQSLLGHVNPYTGKTLARDPAVAIVEVNNENGLVHAWQGRVLDGLPGVFAADLRKQWNAWLGRRYGSTAKLRAAWGARREELGAEELADLAAGRGPWNLEQHEGAKAVRITEPLAPAPAPAPGITPGIAPGSAARIDVTHAGNEGWFVQLFHPGLAVTRGGLYTFSFRAKADSACKISVVFSRAHAPWDALAASVATDLGPAWKTYRYTFLAQGDETNARVGFSGLGARQGSYWFAGVSLRPGGATFPEPEQTVEAGTIALVPKTASTAIPDEAVRDFLRFLSETESAYWLEVADYVKKDLGFRGVVVGTALSCSTPNIQARLDAVDTHAYAPHPHFPHRAWDPADWTVANQSEVADPTPGGALAHLALQAVAGKPHLVTEYNQAAPNTYASEAPLLLAAMAGFQDWDGVFLFDYGGGRNGYDARKIEGFFGIGQHPTKMANLPLAAALFRRADVAPARTTILTPMTPDAEVEILRSSAHFWDPPDAGKAGVPAAAAVVHGLRLGVGRDAGPGLEAAQLAALRGLQDQKRLVSDTGQIVWDRSAPGQATVTISTPRTRVLIGFADGRRFDLDGVTLAPGRTRQGWCTLGLTLTAGPSFAGPAHILAIATGYAQNTDMGWKNKEKTTVGADWGKAPSLVEVVHAGIELPVAAARVTAWALDARGQHAAELPVTGDGAHATIELGPPQATVWYEIVVR